MFKITYSSIAAINLFLLGWLLLLPESEVKAYIVENGPIENLSATGWFVAAFALVAVSRRTGWWDGYLGAWTLCLAGFRELDLHKKFTSMSVLKIKLYLSHHVSATEKITVVIVLLLCSFPVFLFLKRNLPLLTCQVRRKYPPALALVFSIAFGVMSKILDRLPNGLREEGFFIPVDLRLIVGITEEVMELGLPCFFIAVIFHYLHAWKVRPEGTIPWQAYQVVEI